MVLHLFEYVSSRNNRQSRTVAQYFLAITIDVVWEGTDQVVQAEPWSILSVDEVGPFYLRAARYNNIRVTYTEMF